MHLHFKEKVIRAYVTQFKACRPGWEPVARVLIKRGPRLS